MDLDARMTMGSSATPGGIGQFPIGSIVEAFESFGVNPEDQFGPGMMYVALRTPIGTALVDPFSATQDSTTTRIMNQLGVELEVGLGDPR